MQCAPKVHLACTLSMEYGSRWNNLLVKIKIKKDDVEGLHVFVVEVCMW